MGKSLNILGDCLIGIFVKFGAWIQNARETKQAKLATFTLSALHVLYSLSKHMVASTHNISNIINLFFFKQRIGNANIIQKYLQTEIHVKHLDWTELKSLVEMSELMLMVEASAEDATATAKEKTPKSARAAPRCKACGQLVK